MTIAVCAVQGAFIEHEKVFEKLNVHCIELRKKADLDKKYDAIVFSGGESTVQGKLLKELGMFDILKNQIDGGMPVFATCAGLILLAENISNDDREYFKTLPVTVRRNAYGRQLGSFTAMEKIKGVGEYPMTFIRAPVIETVGDGVEIISTTSNQITGVKYRNQLALTFHPELTNDYRVHKMFLSSISI